MLKKIFSRQSQTITGAAIVLAGASLFSGVIGLARDRIFAHYFGAGDVLDAYYAAFRIPDFLFNLLLAGAITTGFVPVFLELYRNEKKDAWRVTNAILSLMGLAMIIASSLLWLYAPSVVHRITPGFTGEKLQLTIRLTRIILLSPILLGLSGIVSGALHALRQFAAFSIAPLVYNLCIIAGAVFLVPLFGPIGLAWGVVLGALLHLLVQLPILYNNGFSFTPVLALKDRAVKKIIGLVIPRTFSMATTQINFIILDSFASSLATGSIAIFYLANNIYYVPIGLIGQSFSLAAFPLFANYAAEGKTEALIQHFGRVVRQILFLSIPSLCLLIVLRAQIVRIALGSGKFDWTATSLTASVLAVLAISMTANCVNLITARALFALKHVWSTFWTSVLGVLITASVGYFARTQFGILGLAAAMSLSISMQTIVLWWLLRHYTGNLGGKKIIQATGKIMLASAALVLTVQIFKKPVAEIVDMTRLWGVLSQGAICGTVGALAYGLVCHLLKLEEVGLFQASFKKRWLKIKN